MTLKKLEKVKNQAELLEVSIIPIDLKNGEHAVAVGSHSYTVYSSALTALTTVYLRNNKSVS